MANEVKDVKENEIKVAEETTMSFKESMIEDCKGIGERVKNPRTKVGKTIKKVVGWTVKGAVAAGVCVVAGKFVDKKFESKTGESDVEDTLDVDDYEVTDVEESETTETEVTNDETTEE
jgi:hypothetical protein